MIGILRFTLLTTAVLLPASPVLGQTSTCQWVGSVWTCQGPRRGVDMMGAVRAGQDLIPSYRDTERADAERRQIEEQTAALAMQRKSHELRAQVGGLLAEGKCDDARQMALKAGDLGLAREVQGFCSTGTEG